MSTDGIERVTFTVPSAELAEVDNWMFSQRIRSRSEAIRQLLQLGLDAAKQSDGLDASRKTAADERKPEAG